MIKKKIDNYEENTLDVPDMPQWEGKLNPDAHIHYGLLSLQKMLAHENPKIGFLQYSAQVRHIESIAWAAKRLDNDYAEAIKSKQANILEGKEEEYIKQFLIAQYKLEKILEACFSNIPLTSMGRV